MGKPKGRKSNQKSQASSAWKESKDKSPSPANVTTADGMIEKIEGYMELCDFRTAEKFANRGLEKFPEDPKMLESAAECFTEIGHVQKARTCYEKAIAASPLKGWRKYLGLAQLLEAKDALLQYTRGVEVMEREYAERKTMENPPPENQNSPSSSTTPTANSSAQVDAVQASDISNAYLSIAELYTTDLCDEGNAEECCKYALEKAMMMDPSNPECFQQMTNFYLIKGDKTLAKQYVRGGLSLWYKPDEEKQTPVPSTTNNEETTHEEEEESQLPPVGFQVETAKALIECEEHELANRLLSDLISQSPADPELWYLSGLNSFLHGESHYAQARSDLLKAKKFSTTPHGVCYDIIAQCDEHLAVIAEKLPQDTTNDSDNDSDHENENNAGENPTADGDSDWETDEDVNME